MAAPLGSITRPPMLPVGSAPKRTAATMQKAIKKREFMTRLLLMRLLSLNQHLLVRFSRTTRALRELCAESPQLTSQPARRDHFKLPNETSPSAVVSFYHAVPRFSNHLLAVTPHRFQPEAQTPVTYQLQSAQMRGRSVRRAGSGLRHRTSDRVHDVIMPCASISRAMFVLLFGGTRQVKAGWRMPGTGTDS